MGMPFINTDFARRIIEKYSFPIAYELEAGTLVYYQEPAAGSRTNSAYYMGLTLKLSAVFEKNQTILKQLSGITSKLQQKLLSLSTELQTEKAAKPVRLSKAVTIIPKLAVQVAGRVLVSSAAVSGKQAREMVAGMLGGYEGLTVHKTEYKRLAEQVPLASKVFTIMKSRFTDPGRAAAAEKELLDILYHDFHIKESEILWREDKKNQSVQKHEEQIQKFMALLEMPKVIAAVRRRIEESDKKSINRLKIWVQQVKQTWGSEAAQKLERYFRDRGRIAGRAAIYEAVSRMEKTARSIINSYMTAARTEDLAVDLGGGDSVYLRNLLREQVHEPDYQPARAARRNLEAILAVLRRDYRFYQEKSRLLVQIKRNMQARSQEKSGQQISDEDPWSSDHETSFFDRNFNEQRVQYVIRPTAEVWEGAQTEFLKRQRIQADQMEENRRSINTLSEKIKIQEKIITELKRTSEKEKLSSQLTLNQLTRHIMKTMETELRLEKMRHGLL